MSTIISWTLSWAIKFMMGRLLNSLSVTDVIQLVLNAEQSSDNDMVKRGAVYKTVKTDTNSTLISNLVTELGVYLVKRVKGLI